MIGRVFVAAWLVAAATIGNPGLVRAEPTRIVWRVACAVAAPPGTRCGVLIVPERRDKTDSRSISVPIAVIPAPDQAGKPADPFLFLMGGTGAGFSVLTEVAPLPGLTGRDVIVVEQRGNAMAEPFYGCESLPPASRYHVSWNSGPPNDPASIDKCRAELRSKHIDIDAYATPSAADDLVDLRRLLGVARWNVYGVSYGARVATTLLRKDPDGFRSMILDSGQITGANFSGWDRLDAVGAFFARCEAAAECGRRFPGLRAAFERTLARVNQHPISVTVAGRADTIDAADYLNFVVFALYDRGFDVFTRLPEAIIAADRGRFALLMTTFGLYAHEKEPLWDAAPGWPIERSTHIAQQVEMLCAEEYGFHPPRLGMDAAERAGWSRTTLDVVLAGQLRERAVCKRWGFQRAPASQSTPPTGAAPTLILNGDHDPVAPAAHGAVAAKSLAHARQVVFSWTGHAVLEERPACAAPLVAMFLADPAAPLDASCAAQIPEPAWLASDPAESANLDIVRAAALNAVAGGGIPGRGVFVMAPRVGVSGVVAAGYADPAAKTPLTGHETFRIASQTKVFTAVAILRLAEDGRLDLDQPIAGLISPDLEAALRKNGYDPGRITPRLLLSHNSGLPDYADDPGYEAEVGGHPHRRWTRLEQVRWAVERVKSPGAPGAVFDYSDTGFDLLGDIIERRTGLPQAPAYRSLIDFDAIGLRHTWFETLEPAPADAPPRAHQFARGYDATDTDPSFDLYGGGGLVSTLEDQALWMSALFTGKVFKHPETLRAMLTIPAVNGPAGANSHYALGIHSVVIDGWTCWGHGGFWGSSAYYCPDGDLTMAASRYTNDEPLGYGDGLSANTAAAILVKLQSEPAHRP